MSVFRRQIRFWALWTLMSATLLVANPWGRLGFAEVLAVLGPFALILPRKIWREAALAIGFPTLTLVWLADPEPSSVLRLLFAWAVFGGGIVLAARVLEAQDELEALMGNFADGRGFRSLPKPFHHVVECELGRARRHDRHFIVLSASVHPRSIESNSTGFVRSELLQSLAVNRATLELYDFLRTELHLYSEVVIEGARILAVVPEADPESAAILLERLKNTADEMLDFDLQLGTGCFPEDAICVGDLIEAADRDRNMSKLHPLSKQIFGQSSGSVPQRTTDVQA